MAAKRRWTLATLVVLALIITGCNGDDAGEAEPTPTPTVAPTAADAETEAPAAEAPKEAADADGSRTYVVKRGDTLSEIAERFDTTVRRLVEANDIKNPNRIKVGRKLKIPAPR